MRSATPQTPEGDGTQRLTAAWVLALAAVGILAIASNRVVVSTLELQAGTIALASQVEHNQELANELAAAGEELVDGGYVEVEALVALARSRDELAAGHDELVASMDGARATVDRAFRDLDRASTELLDHTREVRGTAGPTAEDRTLARDLSVAASGYRSALDQVQSARFAEASGDIASTTRLQHTILLGLLALLVLEAFLVFRPATQRIQRTLEYRRRQAEAERERSQKQLESLARYDHLTGLANRMMFRDRLQHAVDSATRSGKHVALMFIDLDKFKDVNDQLGHDAGDELLVEVAERLQEIARRTDTIARIGGDEFTVILEGLDAPDGAATVAQKILASLTEPFAIRDHEVQVTGSIGIATYPDDARSTEDLLRNADTAMYSAKASGKNTFQFSTPELREATLARLQMIQDLRTAITAQRLRLVYQPQIALETDEVVGVEALVRWVRSDGDEVPAAEFIGIAEDTDLMVPLGEWVVREACQQAVLWEREGLRGIRVAVNLSGRQFRQPNVATMIATALNETGLDPARLELEVTEGSLVEDVESSNATLRLLKGIGVRIAIDDFGTGYSSLNYLKEFPIDALKIDDSFLASVGSEDASDHVVPAAITDLAKHLGMETTAEGVETEHQLQFLRSIGVDRAQGYHLSPPIEPGQLMGVVRRRRIAPVRELPLGGDAS